MFAFPTGRRLAALAGTVVLAVALTACGDDGDSGAPADGGLSGEPIVLGSVLTIKNPAWSNQSVADVNEAWATYLNTEKQGVKGRPIEVKVCDDEGDPAKSSQCVADLLDEGVVAFVNNSSLMFGNNALPAMEKAGAANIGGWPITPAEYNSPNNYPTTPGAAGSYPANAAYFIATGARTVTLVYTEGPAGQGAADATAKVWQSLGGTGAELVSFDPTAPDYIPVMKQVANKNTDCVILLVGAGPAARMFQAAKAADVTAPIGATSTAAVKSVLDAAGPAADGIYFSFATVPSDATTPAAETYRTVMKKYAPEVELSNQAAVAVSSMEYAYHVLTSVPGEVTRDAVLAELKKKQPWDGFLTHATDPAAAPSTMPQVWNPYNLVSQYTGGAFKPVGADLTFDKHLVKEDGLAWFTGSTPGTNP